MNLNDLDNPGWHALNSYHQQLSIKGALAARYQPDTFQVAAMPENTVSSFDDINEIVNVDETLFVVGTLSENLAGWQVLQRASAPQMVCADLKPAAQIGAIQLHQADVPETLELIELAQPGPFLPRTIEMGDYFGMRQDGKLVAMAGERMHLSGYCEISAVCTHPDYRSRGYADSLVTMVAERIIDRGETPFLHVRPDNHSAIQLYQKLGFRLRTEIQLSAIQRLDS